MNAPLPATAPSSADATAGVASAKIVVAGGFGVGKTTFVNAVSEIPALRTEAGMTTAAESVDGSTNHATKTSTTVAMDFGRISVDNFLKIFLFGTPGQDRFAFMWDKISVGALGAVVLVDTNRISDSYAPIDYFESRKIPFVVAVNTFPGAPGGSDTELREALSVGAHIPITRLDARDRNSVKATLLALVDHLLSLLSKPRAAGQAPASAPAAAAAPQRPMNLRDLEG